MLGLQDYGGSSSESDTEASTLHLKPIEPSAPSVAKSLAVCAAPAVVPMVSLVWTRDV